MSQAARPDRSRPSSRRSRVSEAAHLDPAAGRIRRSVALPPDLLADARAAAPPELRDNVNGLVVVALEEYVAHRREERFAAEMARMAANPAARKASRELERAFRRTERDGLPK